LKWIKLDYSMNMWNFFKRFIHVNGTFKKPYFTWNYFRPFSCWYIINKFPIFNVNKMMLNKDIDCFQHLFLKNMFFPFNSSNICKISCILGLLFGSSYKKQMSWKLDVYYLIAIHCNQSMTKHGPINGTICSCFNIQW
jgi:hypothetical protein